MFGLSKNIQLIKNKKVNEYFIDVIFKIIQKIYKPYKLVTVSGINNENNIVFIYMKYLFTESYINLFSTLKELYQFNPDILHTDYE